MAGNTAANPQATEQWWRARRRQIRADEEVAEGEWSGILLSGLWIPLCFAAVYGVLYATGLRSPWLELALVVFFLAWVAVAWRTDARIQRARIERDRERSKAQDLRVALAPAPTPIESASPAPPQPAEPRSAPRRRRRRPPPRERLLHCVLGAFVGAAIGGWSLLRQPADPVLTIGLYALAFGLLAALLPERALVVLEYLFGRWWRYDR